LAVGQAGGKFNSALISGAGSLLLATNGLYVGGDGSSNLLVITDAARAAVQSDTYIGYHSISTNNLMVVAGAGTELTNSGILQLNGIAGRLVVSNGATVFSTEGRIGGISNSLANAVVVTDAGSVWSNKLLFVGYSGSDSQLLITNAGTVFAGVSAYLGFDPPASTNNRLVVDGGRLLATNGGSSGLVLDSGTAVLNAGLMQLDFLFSQLASGVFEFNGGTLKIGRANSTYDNGRVFTVGDGTRTAALQLAGGTASFVSGLVIANNATLTGSGTVVGTVFVTSGGTISPGDGIGTLILSNSPSMGGRIIMEVFKTGATRLNDQIQLTAPLIYGGSLIVSNVGVGAFALGDNFKLFNATAYGGSFPSLTLPPLNAGLGWTNKLLIDGSIEVIAVSLSQPKFSNISVSGTNLILSGTNGSSGQSYGVLTATNINIASSNWTSLVTNQFGAGGGFTFTNPITPGDLQRYFRLRVP
jgi:T5SS/PEP-CTERM-associated repeat protein